MESFGKCDRCPIVCSIKEQLESIERRKLIMTHIATDHLDEVTEMLGEHADEIGQGIMMIAQEAGQPEVIAELDSPEGLGRAVMKGMAKSLDLIDKEHDEVENQLKGMTLLCEGPISMRARRSGMVITARVCASTDAPKIQGGEPSYVQRQPEE